VTCPSYPETLIWPSASAFVSWNLKEILIKDELSLRPREKKYLILEVDKQTRFQVKLLFAVLSVKMLSL